MSLRQTPDPIEIKEEINREKAIAYIKENYNIISGDVNDLQFCNEIHIGERHKEYSENEEGRMVNLLNLIGKDGDYILRERYCSMQKIEIGSSDGLPRGEYNDGTEQPIDEAIKKMTHRGCPKNKRELFKKPSKFAWFFVLSFFSQMITILSYVRLNLIIFWKLCAKLIKFRSIFTHSKPLSKNLSNQKFIFMFQKTFSTHPLLFL